MKPAPAIMLLLTALSAAAGMSPEKLAQLKEQELTLLKSYVENERDSLQVETTQRYVLKQQLMQQRESDKEEFDRLRESQERTANQLSQAKEDVLAKEQQVADERKTTGEKTDEWHAIVADADEAFGKEAASLAEAIPLERARRQADLEEVRRAFGGSRDAAAAWRAFASYKAKYAGSGGSTGISHERMALDDGALVNLTLARFGNVFAYGMDTAGGSYILRQTGRLGEERYTLSKIGSPQLAAYVQGALPAWVQRGKPSGEVLIDVMQNEQSKLLISGKKSSWWNETYHSFRQGGAVMVPLLFLPLWVFFLVTRKAVQIYRRKAAFGRQFKKVMAHLDTQDYGGALSYIKNSQGAMARILQTCIEYRGRDRHGCERAVREIIYHEIPLVNRGINTVAVIAGAAPLLGLLGTISGMITLFAAVTHYGTGDPKFLAGGISEALITAKTGLAIAIPSLFLYDWLRGSKESLLADVEVYAAHAMNRFWPEG